MSGLVEVFRITKDGDVFVRGVKAGNHPDLAQYLYDPKGESTTISTGCAMSVRPFMPPEEADVRYEYGHQTPTLIQFFNGRTPWVQFFHDRTLIRGEREDDPMRVFNAIIEWMQMTRASRPETPVIASCD